MTLIATQLGLSVKTISTSARALEKMNLSSNAELCRYAVDHSLLS